MNSYRVTAIIVGSLFIIATATAIAALVVLGSTLDEPDYLSAVASNETQVVAAMVFELILAVSVIGIGFLMYPVLRMQIRSLAVSYAAFRLVEGVFIMIASISLLSLLTLSQEYVAAAADFSVYEPAGSLLLALREWAFVYGTLTFLGLGGLALYYLLYRSRLVPRWLSGWGIIGAALIFITGIIAMFGLDLESNTTTALAAPIAFQEMVFAVWLIVKGFDQTAVAEFTES